MKAIPTPGSSSQGFAITIWEKSPGVLSSGRRLCDKAGREEDQFAFGQ